MSSNNNGIRVLKGLRVKDTEQPPWGGQAHTAVPRAGYLQLLPSFLFFVRAANSFLSDLLHSLQGGNLIFG